VTSLTARVRNTEFEPGWGLFPLRLFLGGTFVYAGIQKLSDPGFLHPGAPTYIGTQLRGFANGTPGGFLLDTFAIPHAQLAGVGVALVEIAVGLFVLAGLLTRAAAAVGLSLNLVLFLTASWKTSPYFLGPDIVFVFAWLPFVLAGARGQPVLFSASRPRAARGRAALARGSGGEDALTRRRLLGQAVAGVGAATVGIAGLSALVKGRYTPPTRRLSATVPKTAPAHHASKAATTDLPSGAVRIGQASRLPPGHAALYRDPADGSSDILVRGTDGKLTALSAICTHAGCTVGYQNGQIACPCHGATYDATTGQVTGGPAPRALAPKKVLERGGQIYALPS
jgi:thiosulfate dehydrogenase [quinone] large subunit